MSIPIKSAMPQSPTTKRLRSSALSQEICLRRLLQNWHLPEVRRLDGLGLDTSSDRTHSNTCETFLVSSRDFFLCLIENGKLPGCSSLPASFAKIPCQVAKIIKARLHVVNQIRLLNRILQTEVHIKQTDTSDILLS